ncbi:MAG: efflux RND transporter permease subunit, partial [Alphaproteobacteria bacterium]|nr:efflux RND transporter permease subunit [Alphaproteobacteria bacterium]
NMDIVSFAGMDFLGGGFKNSAATIFVTQKHWDERDVGVKDLVGDFFMKTGGIKEAMVMAFPPPAIFGLGNTGGFEFYIQNKGTGGPEKLAMAMGMFMGAAHQDPRLAEVFSLWKPSTPQLKVDLDREKAKALGVPIDEAMNTLAATLGSYYVNDFNIYGRAWQVIMSADAPYRKTPEDVGRIHVRSRAGQMVPMSAIANIGFSSGPDTLTRYNNLPAVSLRGEAAPGMSSGQALAAVEDVLKKVLPPDMTFEWTGASYQEKRSSGSSNFALVFGVGMVFLILAALYNSWALPVSVLMALPFGVFGALLAVMLRGMTNDVYFQIGLVTLLGLAAKNAILLVEYALLKHREGWPVAAAALESARLRFRPILMTALTFILGVSPLAFSEGAGAGARTSAGTGVMGGMLGATFLAIFFIPLFFKLMTDRKLYARDEDFIVPGAEVEKEGRDEHA